MSYRNVPMFDAPQEQPVGLSKALAVYAYRLAADEAAKWSDIKVKAPRDCQECAQLQHETGGVFGPRRQAKHRRAHPMGPKLELCSAHTEQWKVRDLEDSHSGKKAS